MNHALKTKDLHSKLLAEGPGPLLGDPEGIRQVAILEQTFTAAPVLPLPSLETPMCLSLWIREPLLEF